MIQKFISGLVARLCGRLNVYSAASNIRGNYSDGRRDAFTRDFNPDRW